MLFLKSVKEYKRGIRRMYDLRPAGYVVSQTRGRNVSHASGSASAIGPTTLLDWMDHDRQHDVARDE